MIATTASKQLVCFLLENNTFWNPLGLFHFMGHINSSSGFTWVCLQVLVGLRGLDRMALAQNVFIFSSRKLNSFSFFFISWVFNTDRTCSISSLLLFCFYRMNLFKSKEVVQRYLIWDPELGRRIGWMKERTWREEEEY